MWNIIRATLYQLKSDFVLWSSFVGISLFGVLMGIDYMDAPGMGSLFVADMGMGMLMFAGFCLIITGTNIVAKDFSDKTAYYELMSGHTRGQVFFGRVVVAVPLGMLLCFGSMIIPPVVITLMTGWGEAIAIGEIIVRYALVLACLFPAMCIVVTAAIMIRNHNVTFLVMFVFNQLQIFLVLFRELWDGMAVTVLTPVSRCVTLHLVQSRPEIDAVTGAVRYDMAISMEEAMGIVGGSVVWGLIILATGYAVFRKSDLN